MTTLHTLDAFRGAETPRPAPGGAGGPLSRPAGAPVFGPQRGHALALIRLVHGRTIARTTRDALRSATPREWLDLAEFVESSDRSDPAKAARVFEAVFKTFLGGLQSRHPETAKLLRDALRAAWEGVGATDPGDEAEAPPERGGGPADFDALSDEALGIVGADTIKPQPVEWVWRNRIAGGKLNLLAGEGGDGKSQAGTAIVASVTTGGPLPDGSAPLRTGSCLILAAEDGASDTIVPRLMAAGADLARVKVLTAKVTTTGKDGKPLISIMSFQDLAYWRAVFRRLPDARLLIADPLPAYLGRGVNDHRNNDVRTVLEPFVDLLETHDVGMLAVTHLNKSVEARTPTHRILGSVAYANLARTVHVTCRDPEDQERRMFCWVKGNLTEPQPVLAFRIATHSVNDGGREIPTSKVVFEDKPLDVEAADVMSGKPARRGPDAEKTVRAAEWLVDFLGGEGRPVCLAKVFEAAGAAGFAGRQKDDGKWSGTGTLYDAARRVPSLPGPRNGRRIETLEMPLSPGGRSIKHWRLRDADDDAAF